jgi:hypothetical protein
VKDYATTRASWGSVTMLTNANVKPAFPKYPDVFTPQIASNVLYFSMLLGLKEADNGSPGGCERTG